MDPVLEMRRRVRNHFLFAVGGVVTSFLFVAVSVGTIQAISGGAPWGAQASMVASLVGFSILPLVGFWSTWRNLRCPACNGWVAFQVSQKYSAFGALARNECRHCGVTIFAPRAGRMLLLVLVAIAFLVFAGALGAVMAGQHARQAPATSGP